MSAEPGEAKPIFLPLFEELRGQKVVIRPFRESDVAPYYEAIEESREHLGPWLPIANFYHCEADVLPWIRRGMADWFLREDLKLHMWDAQTERFLGGCGMHPRDWRIKSFEIGYWLRASATGKGYMTEAVRLMVDYLFDVLQAQRIMIRCEEQNHRSAAVPRRLGFVYEGTMRHVIPGADGTLRNAMIFSLIPSDRQ
ncbi:MULTISPECIES: GNAT family N-acetyltransferase [Ktedonobacter]|uniref:Ribosomal-protein-serine acetyltransferase n=1 Tax=Ktedonobacter robiniae TaxID=2778365 RepID=A0ABQ3UNE4_9CHLR|nr:MULTISPECIES: GNAT family protein [Ktedonobacter]GHO54264.1 ribosomal-protein-serine acetyltransferase [Ktedonobacter robiniae]GHO66629.1 ribosomal-protein-serine acetyltransferase [Ktedonobacter sp. SOSP1-52]